MAEYVTLLGAEDVSRAASSISTSAGEMRQAAGYIDESLTRFILQFEALVERMEAVVNNTQQEHQNHDTNSSS